MDEAQQSAAAAFPIVGIGASAGGLEAFEQFFRACPADSGMAFVLVPHLDPGRDRRINRAAMSERLAGAPQWRA